ncbi:hybrid sensor histidine kinase/response regulator [Paenibacillus sonchi]|uniref:hybrid sensor histidine kinase/response regulator n=1 Tax=Paenibacillus sonchi TaxID=373687 RepID=UPI001E5D61DF|nr:ATP-binding protein [Paenibacillus sonchi]MCE3198212.1 response regulator [Paenibacillus sonchi]
MLGTLKKPFIAIVVFIVFITAVRLVWTNYLTTTDYAKAPAAQDGVLDLRNFSFTGHQTLQLKGEWTFYPSVLLVSGAGSDNGNAPAAQAEKVFVPDLWDGYFPQDGSAFHYGTYRLQIRLDQETKQTFAMKISRIGNASSVYVNGQLLASSGHPSSDPGKHQAQNVPYTVTIPAGSATLDLVIEVSHNAGKGGIERAIRFGTVDAIQQRNSLLTGLQLLLCVILFINALYGIILRLLSSNKGLSYFAFFMIFTLFSVLISDDRLLFQWFHMGDAWEIKIVYLTYIGVNAFMCLLINSLFPSRAPKVTMHIIAFCWTLYALFILISPSSYIQATSKLLLVLGLTSVILGGHILRRAIQQKEDVIFLLLACIGIGINILWSAFMHLSPENELIHYPFDLIFALLAFAAFWFKRFFHAIDQSLLLAGKLQLEDKRKDEFLVNTSHELRNPLQGISTMLQVILDDQAHPVHPKQQERVEIIKKVSSRMSFMLDDLIDITRLKEQTIPLEIKPVRLQSVVSGVLDMIKVMLDGKPVQLRADIEDTFPAVQADEQRVIQILFNLLHNAVKFTDKGFITVRAVRKGPMAEVQVEDTGIGIPEEALLQIFHPYEQADNHFKRASGGFGLGLSICRQLVELHGGTITAESSLGERTLFRFTLPLGDGNPGEEDLQPLSLTNLSVPLDEIAAAAEPPVDRAIFPNESGAPACRILIVDDDAVNLNVLAQMLGTEGYMIDAVTSAELALAETKRQRYDLVITDVMMPHMSGYELTELIRERFNISELPILLLTARVRTEDILTGFRAGANDYVKKPVDAWELKARVHALTQLKTSIDDRLRMESAWLQSQIQPHFLFNTLNSIAALGMIDFNKMQTLLDEFSNYLRLSFDFKNASPLVPLEHELSLVRSYVYIEKERFGSRLTVVWNIESGIDILIPPLSIQPLVENAIKHGLLSRNRGGTVSVNVSRLAEMVDISIIDDGGGMDKDYLSQLLNHSNRSSSRSGIGLININRRLMQQFGTGLDIQSSLDQGTCVSFQIPYQKG